MLRDETTADPRFLFPPYLSLVDRTLILYLVSLSILAVFRRTVLTGWQIHLLINLGIIALILGLARLEQQRPSPLTAFGHAFYAVFLLIWLYPQACLFRHTLLSTDLDPLLLRWELSLFGREWYRILPERLSTIWLEYFHGVYFGYYIGLGLFAMLVFRRRRLQVDHYLFTLIATMVLHQWFLILFPASGPVALRAATMPKGYLFIPVMEWIYAHIDQGGGAFPSLHAAAAVIMIRFAVQEFPAWKYPLLLFLASILVATVACSFHYAVDTVAGAINGYICSLAGPYLFMYFSRDVLHENQLAPAPDR
jgi:membrane-associated phospholipid phosphatase